MTKLQLILSLAALGAAAPLAAQGIYQGVPSGWLPPAGMCRIWIDGVPANRQPPPTDCNTAVRRVPRNGQVIYGPNRGYNGSNYGYGAYQNQQYPNQPYYNNDGYDRRVAEEREIAEQRERRMAERM